MRVPDPFAPFEGGFLHQFDIASAEALTGVRGRSWSRHAVQPAVGFGLTARNAIALLHWGVVIAVAVGVYQLVKRRD